MRSIKAVLAFCSFTFCTLLVCAPMGAVQAQPQPQSPKSTCHLMQFGSVDLHVAEGKVSMPITIGEVQQDAIFSLSSAFNYMSQEMMDEIAIAKLEMVGLSPDDGDKFPSELSGGMTKRVALARALALDPAILFLDEPTSGLDPISAGEFDALILTLQKTLGLTVFMVTHDLDSLNTVCDRVAALAGGKIVAIGPIKSLLASDHPWVKAYFHGKRSRTVLAQSS